MLSSTRQRHHTKRILNSLKRVKREQTEEEAGSHRGLCATKPPKEGGGSFFFALAVCAIFAPVILGLGLGMELSSLLLGRAFLGIARGFCWIPPVVYRFDQNIA